MINQLVDQDNSQPNTSTTPSNLSPNSRSISTVFTRKFGTNRTLLLITTMASVLAVILLGYLVFKSDTPVNDTYPDSSPIPLPTTFQDTSQQTPTQPNPTIRQQVECASDNDCGAFNCLQPPCQKLSCINNKCVLVDNPVCGDDVCEDIERDCRSTHPVSMDCGPHYCEADCYR